MTQEQVHHLKRVLRMQTGDAIMVTDGRGALRPSSIQFHGKGGSLTQTGELQTLPAPPALVLLQGVVKQPAMETILRMGTELGVTRFIPLIMKNTTLAHKQIRAKLERWQKIVVSAAEQSERSWYPTIDASAVMSELNTLDLPSERYCLYERHQNALLPPLSPDEDVALLIGPEGGITSEECHTLEAAQFTLCTLGTPILRADTAAAAALAQASLLRNTP